jgi:hypothetical protein
MLSIYQIISIQSYTSKKPKSILFKQIKIHPSKFYRRWMELELLIFSGSLDFKVDLNLLRTTVKKMQRDSTSNMQLVRRLRSEKSGYSPENNLYPLTYQL